RGASAGEDHRRDDFAAAALRDVLHRARRPPRPPGRFHREPERRLVTQQARQFTWTLQGTRHSFASSSAIAIASSHATSTPSSPANGSHGHRRERNGRAAYVAAVFRGLVDVVRKGAST